MRALYIDEEPDMKWYGAPRTVAGIAHKRCWDGPDSRGNIKRYLAAKILLTKLGSQSTEIRFASKSIQASEAFIREVDKKVHELAVSSKITTNKQAVLKIAFAKRVAVNLEDLHAQAYHGCNFGVRDRSLEVQDHFWVYVAMESKKKPPKPCQTRRSLRF